MIVNHALGFIFVSNPKAASTSIDSALDSYQQEHELDSVCSDGYYTPRHMPAAVLRNELGSKIWKNYLTFSVVRNPWSWFISQYYYNFSKIENSTNQDGKLKEKDVYKLYKFLCSRRGVEWETSGCQSSFLCDESSNIIVKHILRFETLETDFKKLLGILGLTTSLPFLNRTVHRPYQQYYTRATANLIAKLYENDIQKFGYAELKPRL